MQKRKIDDLVMSAMGAALIAVCSFISIPSAVPYTLQTFGVYCVLCLFGAKNGMRAILVYLAMGAVGLPVFAGFTSGIGVLFGSTGGYLLGFVAIGILFALSSHFFDRRLIADIIALLIGTVLCYAFGTAWFILVYTKTKGSLGIVTALSWCVFPYILPDMMKLALAVLISRKLGPLLFRQKR